MGYQKKGYRKWTNRYRENFTKEYGSSLLEWIRGDLKTTMAKWSEGREYELAVSFGAVLKKEFPDKDVPQLAVIADERMYQDKENYYKKNGKDRRSCRV